jgi:hypothetical protein
MPPRRKFLYYLYGLPNIVGSLLGLLGLLLYFAGIIQQYWLLIVVGLYLIGVLATPKSKAVHLSLENQLSQDEIRQGLDALLRKIQGRLPKEAYERVESIRGSILEILPRIEDWNSADYQIYTIRQTALQYLPETLENYLNLPKAYASLHPVKEGKTAKILLVEQLTLLDETLKEITTDFYRNDTQRLLTNGRFLQEKFGKQETW